MNIFYRSSVTLFILYVSFKLLKLKWPYFNKHLKQFNNNKTVYFWLT